MEEESAALKVYQRINDDNPMLLYERRRLKDLKYTQFYFLKEQYMA